MDAAKLGIPLPRLGGKPAKGKYRVIDNATGKPKTINGYAVYHWDTYKGWQIHRQWGGFEGVAKTNDGMEVSTRVQQSQRKVRKMIDFFEREAKRQFGVEVVKK